MAAAAFATVTRFDLVPGSATTFTVQWQVVAGDGQTVAIDFDTATTYNAATTPAANLAAAKTAIAAAALALAGLTISTAAILCNASLN